MSIRQDSPLLA
jgi:hypothetical protein